MEKYSNHTQQQLITENWKKYLAGEPASSDGITEVAQIEALLDNFLENYQRALSEGTLTEEQLTEGLQELKADLAAIVDLEALKNLGRKYGKQALVLTLVGLLGMGAGAALSGGGDDAGAGSYTTTSAAASDF